MNCSDLQVLVHTRTVRVLALTVVERVCFLLAEFVPAPNKVLIARRKDLSRVRFVPGSTEEHFAGRIEPPLESWRFFFSNLRYGTLILAFFFSSRISGNAHFLDNQFIHNVISPSSTFSDKSFTIQHGC
jgi:hypothetical protein